MLILIKKLLNCIIKLDKHPVIYLQQFFYCPIKSSIILNYFLIIKQTYQLIEILVENGTIRDLSYNQMQYYTINDKENFNNLRNNLQLIEVYEDKLFNYYMKSNINKLSELNINNMYDLLNKINDLNEYLQVIENNEIKLLNVEDLVKNIIYKVVNNLHLIIHNNHMINDDSLNNELKSRT